MPPTAAHRRRAPIPTPAHLLLATAAVALVACGEAGEEAAPMAEASGAPTFPNPAPRHSGADAWRLSDEPLLQIGNVDGPPEYAFDQIGDVLGHPDGRWVVVNRGDNSLRFFSPEGEFLASAGGTGDGPGEFRFLAEVARVGDELWGIPFSLAMPLHAFDLRGEYVRTVRLPLPTDELPLSFAGAFADGTILANAWPQGMPGEDGLFTREGPIYRLDAATGEATLLLSRPSRVFVDVGGNRGVDQNYGPSLRLAAAGDRFYLGWPERYEIEVVSPEGTPLHTVQADVPLRPVTDADREADREAALALDTVDGRGVPVQSSAEALRQLDRMIYPEHHPAFDRFEVDTEGNLWAVRHFGTPAAPEARRDLAAGMTWDVFGPDGTWLSTLVTPAGFWPRDMGKGRVAGLWRDELGVHYVRVYELVR